MPFFIVDYPWYALEIRSKHLHPWISCPSSSCAGPLSVRHIPFEKLPFQVEATMAIPSPLLADLPRLRSPPSLFAVRLFSAAVLGLLAGTETVRLNAFTILATRELTRLAYGMWCDVESSQFRAIMGRRMENAGFSEHSRTRFLTCYNCHLRLLDDLVEAYDGVLARDGVRKLNPVERDVEQADKDNID